MFQRIIRLDIAMAVVQGIEKDTVEFMEFTIKLSNDECDVYRYEAGKGWTCYYARNDGQPLDVSRKRVMEDVFRGRKEFSKRYWYGKEVGYVFI